MRDSLGSMPMHPTSSRLPGALAALLLTAACQDPAKPPITPAQVVGAWVLILNSPSSCSSSGAGQQLHLDLVLSGQSQSQTATVDGGWDFDARVPPRYSIVGSIDF